MSRLTRWVLTHKLIVIAFWLALTVAGGALSSSAVNALSGEFSVPGREAFETNQQILRLYHTDSSSPPIVPVVALPAGTTVDSPGIKAELASAFARLAAVVPGSRVVSYGSTGNRVFVSRDGRTTFGLIYPPYIPFIQAQQALTSWRQTAAQLRVGGAPVRVSGITPLSVGSTNAGGPGVFAETILGSLGALLVLVFVFRSFMALLPLLMAAVSIPVTFLLVLGLTHVTEVSFIVEFLVALIGLGVAIDYSLIVVLRWREERARGADNEAAVQKAMETAGAAVLFSGTTVAIGLLALIVLPVPFLRSVGYGGMLIPLVSIAVAVTLLPVLLASVGPRLDWPRIGDPGSAGRFWTGWANAVVRLRWVAAAIGLAILLGLASANLNLALGQTQADALAKNGAAYDGLRAIERAGIGVGALSPFDVLLRGGDPAAYARILARVQGVQGAVAPPAPSWRTAGTALVEVFPRADGSSAEGKATLDRIRAVAHRLPGSARVGGGAAENADFIAAVYGSFPLMVGLIALVTFLLLVRAFRSVLLPLKAVALNVLSVGAAWGAIELVWQQGYGSKAIWGIPATGSITSWIPLMVFAFLFGLSMDYEVFILARIREEFDAGGRTNAAVIEGVGRTGRLVTSGALILCFAFVALAAGPQTDVKVIGTGLAAGILLDATVVRMLVVPALISLFGRLNWWLPELPARLLRVQPSLIPIGAAEEEELAG